jgi:hypothetical protein
VTELAGVQTAIFVVTDVELDGPSPLYNSMLSFASVAVDRTGRQLGEFEAVLKPRTDRKPDAGTMAWWATQPEAYAAATKDPAPPALVMARYVAWIEALAVPRLFAARPLILDGLWIDHYLDTFTDHRVLGHPLSEHHLFSGVSLDIASFAAALLGLDHVVQDGQPFSPEWLGNIEHTHRAIDDARGYANALTRLLAIMGTRVPGATQL